MLIWEISTFCLIYYLLQKDVPETIKVTFITKDGKETEVMAKEGERALYLAHRLLYIPITLNDIV